MIEKMNDRRKYVIKNPHFNYANDIKSKTSKGKQIIYLPNERSMLMIHVVFNNFYSLRMFLINFKFD